jgi:plasmid stabilization system protein ParE
MTQTAWTPEDEKLLIRTVIMSGIVVALSKTDGKRQTADELASIEKRFINIARKSSNPFLSSLGTDQGVQEVRTLAAQLTENPSSMHLLDVRPFAMRRCDELAEALATRATPEQAAEVKQAIIDVCQGVAEESKSDAFMGMGGVRVSPEESAMIAEVRRALRFG